MISLNNSQLSRQPATLNETPKLITSTQYSVNGNAQMLVADDQNSVKMIWTWVSPEFLAEIRAIYNSQKISGAVHYKNDASGLAANGILEFDGAMTWNIDEYLRGGSHYIPLTVNIEQADVVNQGY